MVTNTQPGPGDPEASLLLTSEKAVFCNGICGSKTFRRSSQSEWADSDCCNEIRKSRPEVKLSRLSGKWLATWAESSRCMGPELRAWNNHCFIDVSISKLSIEHAGFYSAVQDRAEISWECFEGSQSWLLLFITFSWHWAWPSNVLKGWHQASLKDIKQRWMIADNDTGKHLQVWINTAAQCLQNEDLMQIVLHLLMGTNTLIKEGDEISQLDNPPGPCVQLCPHHAGWQKFRQRTISVHRNIRHARKAPFPQERSYKDRFHKKGGRS